MLAALRGQDVEARRAALVALEAGEGHVDDPICAALIELLAHPTKDVSRRAAGALALAAADPAHRAAIEQALGDGDARRRWGAAFALSRAGILGDAVVRASIEALGAGDGDVRWAAAEVVCAAARARPDIAGAVSAACRADVPERRKMALYCLRDLGAVSVEPFVEALEDADRGVRLAGLAGLARYARLDAAVMARVIACMRDDPDAGVRRAAAATAARTAANDPAAAAALERAASDSDDRDFVRAAARREPGRKE